MNTRAIIRALEEAGWELIRTRGRHAQFRHPLRKGCVTILQTRREIPADTVASIERHSGLTLQPTGAA